MTKKETIAGLKYISKSPSPEHGGFDKVTVDIAKSALELLEAKFTSHTKQSNKIAIDCPCGNRSATIHLCEQCFEDAVTS